MSWQPLSRYNLLPLTTLIYRELIREWRTKHFSLLPELAMSVIFAIIITTAPLPEGFAIKSLDYITFVGLGLVTNSIIINSFSSTAFGMVHAKMEQYLIDFIVPPLSRAATYFGLVVSATLSALFSAVCVGLVLVPFGFTIPHLTATLAIFLTSAIVGASFALLGIVAAHYSKDWDAISAKFSLLLLPVLYLSGVFYSIESIHPAYQWILSYNPIYHLFAMVRGLSLGDAPSVGGLASMACVVASCLIASYVLLAGRSIR